MKATLGNNWRTHFDLILSDTKKPLFLTTQNPFLLLKYEKDGDMIVHGDGVTEVDNLYIKNLIDDENKNLFADGEGDVEFLEGDARWI